MTMHRKAHRLAAATVSLWLAADVASPARAAPFIFALRRTEPVTSLDYLDAQFTETLLVEAQIMEGLVGFDPQNEHVILPLLAKNFRRIDLTTYVFRLRNDVYFHSHLHSQGGKNVVKELVTPDDVEFSLMRARRSLGAKQSKLGNIESIMKVGEDLIKVKLTNPDDDFLSRLASAMGHITCKRYYESLGKDEKSRKAAFGLSPVGTGPYYLPHALVEGQSILLVRFEHYRDQDWVKSTAAMEKVEYRYYDSAAAILAGLKRGEIGGANLMLSTFGEGGFLNPNKPPELGGRYRLSPPFLSLLAINLTKADLKDRLIRELLNAAVDKSKIERICPQETLELPEGYRYYLEIAKLYQTRQTTVPTLLQGREAQERLRALQRRGPITLLVRAGEDATRDRIVASVAEDLRDRLRLDVRIVKTKRFSAELQAKNPSYDLVYVDWTPDTPSESEGLSILYPLFYSASRTNISHFQDGEVDDLFAQVERVVDKGAAADLYTKIQNRLYENPPHIWLPSVRSNTLLFGKGYRSKVRPSSSLVYYASFLKYAERIRK